MALPPKIKTWQYQVNVTSFDGSSAVNSSKALILALKNLLLGFGSNPWVVWGSTDHVSVDNGGGTDYWTNLASLVATFSWIVLENPVTGMQICLDFTAANFYTGTFVVSLSGSFGAAGGGLDGTVDNRPTAPDEYVLWNNGTWCPNAIVTYKLHAMMSTDGECTRVVVCYNNAVIQFWILDVPSSPITGLTAPVAGFRATNAATVCTFALWNDLAALVGQMSGDNIDLFMTCEGAVTSMVGETMTYQDDDTLEWPILPIGLLSTVGAHRGRKGALYDLWWGSTAAGIGNTYPADASNQFVQFSHMIFPWDGSTPETA